VIFGLTALLPDHSLNVLRIEYRYNSIERCAEDSKTGSGRSQTAGWGAAGVPKCAWAERGSRDASADPMQRGWPGRHTAKFGA
jgi:hypothetical protein